MLKTFISPVCQPKFQTQWTHSPTVELAKLLQTMYQHPVEQKSNKSKVVAFPKTAYLFITALPKPYCDQRQCNTFIDIKNVDEYWAWVGLFNSRLFIAHWKMQGDAFHVNTKDCLSVKRPNGWDGADLLRSITKLAQELFSDSVMSKCKKANQKFENWDFYSDRKGEEIIDELDRRLLTAYGLPHDPLTRQLKKMRTGGAHDFLTH